MILKEKKKLPICSCRVSHQFFRNTLYLVPVKQVIFISQTWRKKFTQELSRFDVLPFIFAYQIYFRSLRHEARYLAWYMNTNAFPAQDRPTVHLLPFADSSAKENLIFSKHSEFLISSTTVSFFCLHDPRNFQGRCEISVENFSQT